MCRIDVDRGRSLITVSIGELIALDEATRYIAEVRHTLVANGLVRYGIIVDLTGSPIQPQETVRAMGDHIAAMPKAQRLAIVTGSSLCKMQVRRLFTQPHARIVATMAQGRAWVIDEIEPAPDRAVA